MINHYPRPKAKLILLPFAALIFLFIASAPASQAQCDIGGTVLTITDLPYSQTGLSTCDAGNNLNGENTITCGNSSYLNGDDLVLIFSVPSDSIYHIKFTNATENWTSLKLYQGCPLIGEDGVCLTSQGNSNDKLLAVELEAETDYYLVISRWYEECFEFDLSIDYPLTCPEPGTEGWEIISLPFTETGITTCGLENNFSQLNAISCGNNSYLMGPEIVFIFEAPDTELYHFTLNNVTGSWSSMKLYDGCPFREEESSCIANIGNNSSDKLMGAELVAGQTYYLVVSRWYEECFEFDLTIDYPLTCPEPGTEGWEIISLPFAETGLTTCGLENDFSNITTLSCGSSSYINGSDKVFIFEAPETDTYDFTLNNVTGSWSSMKLYDGCPFLAHESSCIASVGNNSSDKIMNTELVAGQTYYLVVSRWYDDCFEFDLTINVPETCPEPESVGWPVISLPFADTGLTTCGMGDDLQSYNTINCGSNSYYNGEEIVFIFEAPTTDFYHFTMNSDQSWVSMKLHDGCPLINHGTSCIGQSAGSSGNRILGAELEEGQTYYLMVSNSAENCFEFDLTIDLPNTCPEPDSEGWPVISLPFAETDLTTCGMGDDLQSYNTINCGSNSYYRGEEIVFIFEAPTTELYHFTLNSDQSWVSMKLHDGCPLINHGTSCIGQSAGSSGNRILEAELEEGQIYYLMVSNSGENCFEFDLTINIPHECPEPGSPGWPEISLPFAETDLTTCGMGDDLQSYNTISCGSTSYFAGEEVVFIFDAPSTDTWYFTKSNASVSWTSLKLFDGCPLTGLGAQCVGHTSGSGSNRLLEADLQEGQTYYLMVSNSGSQCFDFDLVIDLYPVLSCPDDMEICPGELLIMNMVSPQGGVYSGEGILYDEEMEAYVFNPQGLEGQTIEIQYEFGGFAESTCTFEVYVKDFFEPEAVIAISPEDGSSVSSPILFEWEPSDNAHRYDLYIWRSTQEIPSHPTVRNIEGTSVLYENYLNTTYLYHWQLNAKNECYQTTAAVQNFSFVPLPDLVLTQLAIPSAAIAGSEIEISYTVSNDGEGGSGYMPWLDKFFLSENEDWDAEEAILLGSTENQKFLNAGESYSQTIQLETPYDLEGTFYVFAFTDATNVVSETNTGNNIHVSAEPVEINFPPYPDLEVSNAGSTDASIIPGENFNVSWSVQNIGDAPAEGAWTQRVSIVQDDKSRLLTHVQTSETLAPGGVISENISVTIPETLGWDGDVHIEIELIPDPELILKPHSEENHTALSEESIPIEKLLFLHASPNVLVLGEEEPLRITLSRSGKVEDALEVSVSGSEAGVFDFPETVTIPVNQSSVHFFVNALTETMDDYEWDITLMADATDYHSAEKVITLRDTQLPTLNLTSESNTVLKGESLAFTLTRSGNLSQEFAASFISSKPGITNTPTYVMMAAGESEVSFEISFGETDAVEVHQNIKITALSNGYIAGEKQVELIDPHLPQATLEASPDILASTSGDFASWINVSLENPAKERFTFYVSATPQGILNLPSDFSIAANEWETEFSIGVAEGLDKTELQDIEISLQLYLESCQCLVPEHMVSPATTSVGFTDSSLPSLSVQANPQIVAAGTEDAGVLGISISETHTEDLPVNITLDKDDLILISESVIIPAGALIAELPFETFEMLEDDTSQRLGVVVTADNFQPASSWILVSNRNLPDLVVSGLHTPTPQIDAGESIELTIEITNHGLGTAAPGTDIALYLSSDPQPGNQSFLQGFLQTHEPIAPGETAVITESLNLQTFMGEYYLIAEVNTQKNIHELIYANNVSAPLFINIMPAYYAVASVEQSVYDPGTPVEISGYVRYQNEQPAPGKDVDVYVMVKGVRRSLRTTSNEDGDFSVTFHPAGGEGGDYHVAAAFPGHLINDAQDEFSIPALRFTGSEPQWDLIVDEAHSGSLTIENRSSVPLNDIGLELVSGPEGLQVDFTSPGSLAGEAVAHLDYTITSSKVSANAEYENVILRITSAEGASYRVDAWVHTGSEEGYLVVSPVFLQSTVLQGHANIRELTLTNVGQAETGEVHLNLPDVDWITCISSDTLQNILPGQSAVFTLRVNPGSDLPLNMPVSGNFGVTAENAPSLDIPFSFEPVSENTGSLWVRVANEYTYNTEEAPYLQGATVMLRHLYTGQIIGNDFTNNDGVVTMDNIAEGYYQLWVYKEQHETYVNTVFINMGQQNEFEVLISYQAISYFWDVTPTLIEDEYEINLIAQFETHVPLPVVVMDAPDELPDLGPGEFFPFVITLTNYGLITANNVRIRFSDSDRYTVNYLFDEMDLPAQSSVQIPVIMEANTDIKSSNFEDCWYYIEVPYETECGPYTNTGVTREYYYIGGPGCTTNTGGRPIGSAGGSGGGSISGNPPNLVGYFAGCDCAFEQIEWILSCGLCNIPPVGALCIPYNIYSCFTGVYQGCYGNPFQMSCGENVLRCDPSPVTQAAFCLYDLLEDECLLGGPPGGPGFDDGDSGNPDNKFAADNNFGMGNLGEKSLRGLRSRAEILLELQETSIRWAYELYNDSVWFEAPQAELQFFLDYFDTLNLDEHIEITDELWQHTPSNISFAQLENYIERRNNTLDMLNGLDYNAGNALDTLVVDSLLNRTHELEMMVQDIGYTSVVDMKTSFFEDLHTAYSGGFMMLQKNAPCANNLLSTGKKEECNTCQSDHIHEITKSSAAGHNKQQKSGGTVCARVTLKFSQTLTMTREAFEGTLILSNTHESDAVEDIQLTLNITDMDGSNSNHLFEITTLSLDDISSIDGGGVLEAGMQGSARIQFIPTRDAAPSIPKYYNFGGVLSYTDPFNGEFVQQTLSPVTLEVNPSPDLHIDYFMQRDILGNDPLTDVIEPSIPAELAVMIHNRGAGLARDVSIESAQPEIIDNEKGLLIDFEIIGSNLSGQPTQLGLNNIDFGNLEADEIAIGQWWFTSSLLGHFIDYEVSVIHLNSFDNPDLALISRVDVHELIRSIYAYGDLDDGIDDFLVNNIPDLNDYPDHLYYSHGGSDPVHLAESSETDGTVTLDNLTIELTVEPSATGWNYTRLPDPGNGNYRIVSCIRDDGQEIPIKNIWLTHVRIPDGSVPIYENNMHLVDLFDTVEETSYTVEFEFIEQDLPAVTEINGVPEGVVDDPVTHLEVVFNKPIDPTTFDYEDMVLRNQGGDNLMDSLVTVSQLDDHIFEVDLTGKTDLFGLYSLIVQAAGIADTFGNLGEVGKQVFWIQGMNVPAVVRFFNYPQQSEDPIDSIYVYFNMPVLESTFTSNQLAVAKGGGEELITDGLEVTQIDELARLYRISGLAPLNQEEGIYELTVKVTEITGESGENGFMNQSVQWTIGEDTELFADAGPDGAICATDNFSLNQASTNAFDFSWVGGDGVFTEEDDLLLYTPGSNDIAEGETELCLTAFYSDGNPASTDCLVLIIHPLPETPVISMLDNYILESDAPEGNQWYNQDGAIEGANGQQYVVTEDGDYHVVVTLDECSSEMSNVINVVITGVDQTEFESYIHVYPNPFTDELVLEYHQTSAGIRFEIMNLSGQVVYSGIFSDKTTVNTTHFAPGFYLVKFEDGTRISFRKVVRD